MFLDILKKRRSIRAYEERAVEQAKIDQLIEAALRAPSGRNLQPWEIIVVTERERLEVLSRAKPHGAGFVKNAPLAFVVCADPGVSDIWIEDASIVSASIHFMAASLGLGSCWVQIRERMHSEGQTAGAFIAEHFGLPEPMQVLSLVSIGYPAEEKPSHSRDTLPFKKVRLNRYGNKKN